MQRPAKAALSGAVLLTALGVALCWLTPWCVGEAKSGLAATPEAPLTDLDNDNLPDALEWVMHSDVRKPDTDGDGRSDFVELIEHTDPTRRQKGKPDPDGMRLVINTTEQGPPKDHALWVHLLFRFTSGNVTDLRGLAFFLDVNGKRIPLDFLLPLALAEVKTKFDPTQGLLLRVTLRLPLLSVFKTVTPVTFAAYGLINEHVFRTGAPLFYRGGNFHTMAVLGKTLVFQATSMTNASNPFWTANKMCVYTLTVQGVGTNGVVCEVTKADCKVSNLQRCTAACSGMKGLTFFVPDGLPLITGG